MELGDGVRAIYQNLTVTDEPIQHRYQKPGVYKVTVKAENMAGHDKATMYIQVTGEADLCPFTSCSREEKVTRVEKGISHRLHFYKFSALVLDLSSVHL